MERQTSCNDTLIRIYIASCLRSNVSPDLTKLIPAEIRPRKGRREPLRASNTEDPDDYDCETGCPQAKQRVDPPAFVYDTRKDKEEDTGQP